MVAGTAARQRLVASARPTGGGVSTWYARIVNGTQTGLESRGEAAAMARMSWTDGDVETGVTWTDHDPGARDRRREFELRPVSDEQAAQWRERHPRTPRQ